MTWTDDDKQRLLIFKTNPDCDDVIVKEKIKEVLLNDKYILHVLDNKDLEPQLEDDMTGADEYFGVNILPYFMVTPSQSAASNFVCFETAYEKRRYDTNRFKKNLNIIFYLIAEQKLIKDADTGIAKHDLLAALIINKFNWTNFFGKKIHLISDQASVVDVKYACRTLIFEQITDNELVKSGRTLDTGEFVTRYANKDVVY